MFGKIKHIKNYIEKYLTQGHERSIKAKKNLMIIFVTKAANIVTGLLLLPLTINYVNPTRYGIWITLSSIIGWFSFFDIGLGNGLRNKFSEAVTRGHHRLAKVYVSTTYAILSIIILVVLSAFLAANHFLNWSKILNAPESMTEELNLLAMIVFVFFCIQFVAQLITTILTANQKPAKASLIFLLGNLFSLIGIFILLKTTSGNLIYMGLTLGSMPIIVLIFSSLWLYNNEFKKYAPSIRYIKLSSARSLAGIGFKFFFIQISGVVIYQTSNIIIAQLFGPEKVTVYNVAYKYFNVIPMIMAMILLPFWSAFTEAWVKQDKIWIRSTISKLRILWLMICVISIFMLITSNIFYRLLVGKQIIVPFSLSFVLMVYVNVYTWNGLYCQFLNGVGKIDLQLYSGLAEMALNIPLALFLGKHLGISGVILSPVIMGFINMIWEPLQVKLLLENKATGIFNR